MALGDFFYVCLSGGLLIRSLLYPDEVVGVVASALGFAEEEVAGVLTHLGGTGEDPEVLVVVASDEGVGVVGGEHEDAVVGVEGSPEADAEETGSGGEFALAFGGFPLVAFEALVDDFYLAVLFDGVDGGDLLEVALEFVVEAGDLIPASHEAVEVEGFYGGVVDR